MHFLFCLNVLLHSYSFLTTTYSNINNRFCNVFSIPVFRLRQLPPVTVCRWVEVDLGFAFIIVAVMFSRRKRHLLLWLLLAIHWLPSIFFDLNKLTWICTFVWQWFLEIKYLIKQNEFICMYVCIYMCCPVYERRMWFQFFERKSAADRPHYPLV